MEKVFDYTALWWDVHQPAFKMHVKEIITALDTIDCIDVNSIISVKPEDAGLKPEKKVRGDVTYLSGWQGFEGGKFRFDLHVHALEPRFIGVRYVAFAGKEPVMANYMGSIIFNLGGGGG